MPHYLPFLGGRNFLGPSARQYLLPAGSQIGWKPQFQKGGQPVGPSDSDPCRRDARTAGSEGIIILCMRDMKSLCSSRTRLAAYFNP